MSLPDVPNTLREKYYSVMAGQNDADILPDIETAPSTENRYLDYIARNGGGGGGGDVTKAYVDEQDAKKTDKVTSAISGNFAGLDANGNLTDSGKTATDFATAADVTGEDISSISSTSPITDSADGMVQGITIYGQSEVVEGEIQSVGDDGLTVTTCRKNFFNINGEVNYKWTGTAFVVDTDPATMSTVNDGVLTTKMTASTGHTRGQIINVEKNRRYTLSLICDYLPQDGKLGVGVYGVNDDGSMGTYKAGLDSTVVGEVQSTSFAPSTNRIFVEFGTLRVSGASTYPTGSTYSRIQLEKGSNVTEYEQYRGSTEDFTTALPLRGVSDTVRDTLTCTADVKQVETVCGSVRLADLTWSEPVVTEYRSVFEAIFVNFKQELNDTIAPNLLTENFQAVPNNSPWVPGDISNRAWNNSIVLITEPTITTVTDLKASLGDAELVYELATPTATPLTDAEISAFRGLRTFDSTTNVTITDEPEFEIDYLKNTENGRAVADIQTDLQGQIDSGITYSLNEVKTNDVWIDGKPIYRRTIQFTQWNEQFDATSMNMDNFFVDYSHSFFAAHSSTVSYTAPFVNNGVVQLDVWYDINNKKINMRTNGLSGNNTLDAAYYTILYTKTTDTGNG